MSFSNSSCVMPSSRNALLRSVPLNGLRALEAAARHMSFSAAAEELCVTPAAVSHQIKALEKKIGLQLFVRRNRAVTLSPVGQRLAGPLTVLFADMGRLIADVTGGEQASLEVSAMPSFAAKWLAPRLSRFSIRHPTCQVRLEGADRLIDFRRDRGDIGIRYGRGDYADVFVERLTDVAAFPVVSPAFARRHREALRTVGGLLHLPLLHDEASLIAAGLPNWSRWLEAAGIDYVPTAPGLVFESVHMAIEAALAGQGVALGLTPLVDDDLRMGRLVRPFQLALQSPFSFWLVCRRARANVGWVRRFRDWIQSELAPSRSPKASGGDEQPGLAR
jgi:LysR family transcriptional regulator, glycine cleavage system transcriptional activator